MRVMTPLPFRKPARNATSRSRRGGAFGAGRGFFLDSLFSCHSPDSGFPEQFLVG